MLCVSYKFGFCLCRLCCYFGANGSFVCIACMVKLGAAGDYLRRPIGGTGQPHSHGHLTLRKMVERNWTGWSHSAGLPHRTEYTRLCQGISVGLFSVWVSCWTQRARSYLGTGVGDRVGQAFPEGSVCFLSAILGRGRFWLRERDGGPQTKIVWKVPSSSPAEECKMWHKSGGFCRGKGLLFPSGGRKQPFKGPQSRSEPEVSGTHI